MKKESVIQQEIVEYLSSMADKYNFFFFSIPNEGFMSAAIYNMEPNKRHAILNKFKKMGMVPGIPDLCLLHEGRAYMFEVKRPDGKLTEKQKRIDDKLRKCKTPCFVIVSVEDMEKTLQHLWIIK